MEAQLDLLSDSPIARSRDPETSHLAAEAVTKNGSRARQQNLVMSLVRAHPGATSAELAEDPAIWLDRWTTARRLPELRSAGLVRNGDKRQCRVTGSAALTWWPL